MPSKKIIFFLCMIKLFKSAKKNTKNAKLKLLTKENTFGQIEKIQKQNQISLFGKKFLINVIQKNKNTDKN